MLRKFYVKPIIVGIIVFFVSLIVDILMGKGLDYGYAFILAIIFGGLYLVLELLLDYRFRKRK